MSNAVGRSRPVEEERSMQSRQKNRHSVVADLIQGAVAGAVATWVMGKATAFLYDHEREVVRKREDDVRGQKVSYVVAAERAAHLAGIELSAEQSARYGIAIHWALGIGVGALYGLLRDRIPQAGLARGLAFGTAFWLLVDEGANYALGLTPEPTKYPWQTHARGLAGHFVYGTVADAALTAFQPTVAGVSHSDVTAQRAGPDTAVRR
jgi:hypothetical protein